MQPSRDDGSDANIALNEQHLTLRDGTPVLIRRLVVEDAALYPDFLSDVTADDLRLRFFGPMREVSHELLDRRHPGEARLGDTGIKHIEVHPCEQYCSEMH